MPKNNIQALGEPESHTGIKKTNLIIARNTVLKTYQASARNLAPYFLQIKIGGVYLSNITCFIQADTRCSVNNDRIKLRATGVAQFYYISWKGWRTRMKLRFAQATRLVRTTAPGN